MSDNEYPTIPLATWETVRIPPGDIWGFPGPCTLEGFKDGDPLAWSEVSMVEGGTLYLKGREGTYWKVTQA
jgi:hypothetical protein